MNLIRLLAALTLLSSTSLALAQSSERGSIAPGQSKDGAAPSDGALKGGTILPGERSGIPDGKSPSTTTERAARCVELQGTLRDECLEQERRAGTGATKAPETTPPQNPR